ncbi:MAG: hypothetical protein HT580_15420 [Dechloromonas sp.]|nr:MAG: hypothetical protein HT580_15420 [Dechloromonas sp.]
MRVANAAARSEIEDLAPLLLRIEVVLRATDLEKMNLSSPEDWHLTEFNDPAADTYRKVFDEVVRKRLQLDVWHATEAPSEETMASLADTHRMLLEFHLQETTPATMSFAATRARANLIRTITRFVLQSLPRSVLIWIFRGSNRWQAWLALFRRCCNMTSVSGCLNTFAHMPSPVSFSTR